MLARAAVRDCRIVVVVGGAADPDVVRAGGCRLEGQVRVAPLLVVERQRRAIGAEDPQQAGQPAARRLGDDAGVDRVAGLERRGVEIDVVGRGQELRRKLDVAERIELQRRRQGEWRSSEQGATVEPFEGWQQSKLAIDGDRETDS